MRVVDLVKSAPSWMLTVLVLAVFVSAAEPPARPRIRELGIAPGVLPTGTHNAITDVGGVKVGHRTLVEGETVRTGVTAILPHSGNIFQSKVPAAVYVGNEFGKAAGLLQVRELGNLETPIILTNTLNVGTASRVLPSALGGYTVGALVQSNFGGVLAMDGVPVGELLGCVPFGLASVLALVRKERFRLKVYSL